MMPLSVPTKTEVPSSLNPIGNERSAVQRRQQLRPLFPKKVEQGVEPLASVQAIQQTFDPGLQTFAAEIVDPDAEGVRRIGSRQPQLKVRAQKLELFTIQTVAQRAAERRQFHVPHVHQMTGPRCSRIAAINASIFCRRATYLTSSRALASLLSPGRFS